MKVRIASLAIGVALLSVTPVEAKTNTKPVKRGCQTKACDKRVIKKRQVKARYHFCNTWKCVRKQDRKRLLAVTPYDGWAIPKYIVMCESGGNFRAVNTSNPNRPAGAYQIITSTWLGAGGGQFAPTADKATPLQQHIIAARLWRSDPGGWECR